MSSMSCRKLLVGHCRTRRLRKGYDDRARFRTRHHKQFRCVGVMQTEPNQMGEEGHGFRLMYATNCALPNKPDAHKTKRL